MLEARDHTRCAALALLCELYLTGVDYRVIPRDQQSCPRSVQHLKPAAPENERKHLAVDLECLAVIEGEKQICGDVNDGRGFMRPALD
ncbi:hypothetical protein GCM10007874_01540 [Labrys miyagiensis]|uniref:Transposase n=1 Tax=Labrys miyagiensis TaxID=346912 RepID=A0ABQ6CAB6_9HYPH|nr:hypothetical protein [Labrys miyagiensis]GLS17139.1 hypothetical protein GCM10007874_01540 [Labrys miyagiensis]